MPATPTTVDDYIATFPEEVQERLARVRAALHRAIPGADERIRYGMPAVMLGGPYAVHFAAWKRHIGLYPVTRLEGALEDEIAAYRTHKDSVRFPHDQPVPYELIERLARALAAARR